MFTKTLHVNKNMFFREIFHKINKSAENMLISNVIINESTINYDLLTDENEVSVTIILEGDICILPLVASIVLSLENADVTIINKIKRIWE